MSYESDIPETCDDCRYLIRRHLCWPNECALEGRALHPGDWDDDWERPEWCPLGDDDDY